MLMRYLALVSLCRELGAGTLMQVAAAIQKQIARDVGPCWGVRAQVSAFPSLETVPPACWPVLIMEARHLQADGLQPGLHLDGNGKPYALVCGTADWPLATSRACIELALDPWGCQTIAGCHPREPDIHVEYLFEACAPCQDACFAYAVDGVLVGDFICPAYFEAGAVHGARYSWTGALSASLQVLAGGHLCWLDARNNHWYRLQHGAQDEQISDLGVCAAMPVRGWQACSAGARLMVPPGGATAERQRMLAGQHADAAMARAEWLRHRLEELRARRSPG